MPTFDTPEPISVTIDIGLGDIRIAASDRTEDHPRLSARFRQTQASLQAHATRLLAGAVLDHEAAMFLGSDHQA